MNLSGVVVLLLGLFVFIVAIRGTQASVFPFFFGNSGSSGNSGNGGSKPQCLVMPDSSGNCPNGYTKQSGICFFNGGNSSTCTGIED